MRTTAVPDREAAREPQPAQATLVMRMVDAMGNPLPNMPMELHSTPKTAQTNGNGIVVFGGVESGAHTLYAKDAAGNVIVSRGFELVFGDTTQIVGDQLTVKAGPAFPDCLIYYISGKIVDSENQPRAAPIRTCFPSKANPYIRIRLSGIPFCLSPAA